MRSVNRPEDHGTASRPPNGVVVFLGGSPRADLRHKEMYQGAICAGNHEGADIQGNWEKQSFWERVKHRQTSIFVIDSGSDSWFSDICIGLFIDFLKTVQQPTVIFSPWESEECDLLMDNLPSYAYHVALYRDMQLCFVYGERFGQRLQAASELVKEVRDYVKSLRTEVHVQERIERARALTAFGSTFENYDDAVAFFLRNRADMSAPWTSSSTPASAQNDGAKRKLAALGAAPRATAARHE
mmetsp:Transcript_26255/g.65028  ORF Transcript_26255/g.65028 Transcript_26255/m.65028 type:complete len:242 (+) Transcript_26255:263-988(+)